MLKRSVILCPLGWQMTRIDLEKKLVVSVLVAKGYQFGFNRIRE